MSGRIPRYDWFYGTGESGGCYFFPLTSVVKVEVSALDGDETGLAFLSDGAEVSVNGEDRERFLRSIGGWWEK